MKNLHHLSEAMLSHIKRLFIFHGYLKVLNPILNGEEVSYFLYDNHSYLLEFSIKKSFR